MDRVVEQLIAENAELRRHGILLEKIAFLKQENLRLRAMLDKNSGNSSKPPSTNGFQKIQNSREKSAKKSGGQVGHKGKMQRLKIGTGSQLTTLILQPSSEKC